MADDHGVTHEQLAKQMSDMGVMVEAIRAEVGGIHSQTAVLVAKQEQGDRERAALRRDVRDLRTAHDQRAGIEKAVRWLVGLGSAIAAGGVVAWLSGLFGSGGRGA